MERNKESPRVFLSHNLEAQRLRIEVQLPEVDESKISLDLKKDSFCITVPRNGTEYSGCFLLDHEVEPEKKETRYENDMLSITVPFKGWRHWDRLREGCAGRVVVKG